MDPCPCFWHDGQLAGIGEGLGECEGDGDGSGLGEGVDTPPSWSGGIGLDPFGKGDGAGLEPGSTLGDGLTDAVGSGKSSGDELAPGEGDALVEVEVVGLEGVGDPVGLVTSRQLQETVWPWYKKVRSWWKAPSAVKQVTAAREAAA